MKIVYCKGGFTGGHWAFQSDRSKNPFINVMAECKSVELFPEDVVADVGAYVGEYSVYASRQGVREVRSYEPTPATFAILKRNRQPNMVLHNKAVVCDDRKEVSLYISKGLGATNSVAKKAAKAGRLTVPAIRYEDAVRGATVVKIDVEGAEYTFDIIQSSLRAIILEFHPIAKRDWKGRAREIMRLIESRGFRPIKLPGFKHGWDVSGSWVRDGSGSRR